MKELISDGTKFKPLKQNPTKSREENLSAYLRKLKKDGIIDDVPFPRFYPVDLLLVFCTVYKGSQSWMPFPPHCFFCAHL